MREAEIAKTRNEQIAHRRQNEAVSLATERSYWEEANSSWREAVQADRSREEERKVARRTYHQILQTQMEENRRREDKAREEEAAAAREQEEARRRHIDTVNKVKDKKLQQLK